MAEIHRWDLQETSGTSVTDSVGSNNGTLDTSVTLGVTGPGSGFPNAAEFNGTSLVPIAIDSEVYLEGDDDWVIEFWARQDADNNQGLVLGDSATSVSFVWLSPLGLRLRPATGAAGSADLDFTVDSATRTKWTKYKLTHDVSGALPVVNLEIDGVFSQSLNATAAGIDLSIKHLGAGHTAVSTSMDGRIAGLVIDGVPTVDYSAVDKVVLVLGQSNAVGQFVNNQVYAHPSLYASVFEGVSWKELLDTGVTGEVWPLVATRWLADRNETVGFIYAAVNATALVNPPDWADGGAAYDAAIAMVVASGVTKIDAILWFQGERDANSDVTRAEYAAAMEDLITRLHADLPGTPPLVCGQINSVTGGTTTDEIRNAQADSWANANIVAGPVTYDIGPLADDLHFTTDAEAVTFADRWWAAIDEALFDGTVGTPPSLVSAVVDSTTVTLTYDRDLETASNYTASAWTFDDNGSAIAVSTAVKTGNRTVELTLASVPATTARQVTLGTENSAQGDDVPRGLGGQSALPETLQVASGDATPWQIVNVKNIRRVISIT